jgi:hypothetical protein
MACRCRADKVEPAAGRVEVGRAHGIAVHGGDRGRRLVAAGLDVLCQHAAQRPVERHPFGRHQAEALEHPCLCFAHGEQA